jgi:hypothetical protein
VAEFFKNGTECGWDVVKEVVIPATANFMDYSGMSFRGNKVGGVFQNVGERGRGAARCLLVAVGLWSLGSDFDSSAPATPPRLKTHPQVAITSQEDSALWIGTFDFEALEFVDSDKEQVYHFPRDNHCDMVRRTVDRGRLGGHVQ